MRIRLLTSLAGPRGVWQRGDFYECEPAEAARLVEAGFAEAAGVPIERAVKPRPRARRAG